MVKPSRSDETVTLYVEGGGAGKDLPSECRKAFQQFFINAGMTKKPKVVACGPRLAAYESFCIAIAQGRTAMLLVDSEAPVSSDHVPSPQYPNRWLPWAHLHHRDAWNKPLNSQDTDCHLMVQMMEHWFLADPDTLSDYFGPDFKPNALPKTLPVEAISKDAVNAGLEKATQTSQKQSYKKGRDSFELLRQINPAKVADASPWAKRFIDSLKEKMTSNGKR